MIKKKLIINIIINNNIILFIYLCSLNDIISIWRFILELLEEYFVSFMYVYIFLYMYIYTYINV